MFKKSKSNTTSYGIVGIGRFGYALAIELAKEGNDILIIDCDEEKVAELREYTENAFVVKNIDKKSLQSTGIQNCDVAVVCIGEQLDTSILTTLNLVSMGIPHVISKAKSAEHGEILDLAALFEEAFGSVPFNLAVDNTIESSEDIGE